MKIEIPMLSRKQLEKLPTEGLIKQYKHISKQQLIAAYKLKFNVEAQKEFIKHILLERKRYLEEAAAKAQDDRENADGLSYNEVTLSIN